MTPGTPWLPADTPVPPALDRMLKDLFGEWSGKWIATGPPTAAPLARGPRPDLDWQAIEGGPMLGLSSSAPLTIGARMLGLSPADRPPADRALMEAVAAEALADLRQRLAALVQATRDSAWHSTQAATSHTATLGDPRRPLLAIALTAELFATLALRSLPPPPAAPLGTGEEALERLPVALGAALGRCTLSVAEFQALGLGDVLVLDRAVDRPVPLALAGAPLARGTCTVVKGEPPRLKIVDPIA